MSPNAFGLLVLAGFAVLTAGAILILSALLGPRRTTTDLSVYECGVKPFQSARRRFTVKFYLTAMLFILFDVEAAFLYPWAVTFRDFAAAKWFVLAEMAVFLGTLVAGYLYVWWRGALSWE